ncbi:MAG: metallophosphoesterase [Anaerolineaceae bacterium]|nr:metallophosphoesterase [Anaerolineaceae bacterium]
MIYYTGDTHGEVEKLIAFSERFHLTPEDTIVILGDAGWNYYTDKRDFLAKSFLKRLGVTIFSIHGNHEARPGKLSFYHEAEWRGGSVYVEDEFPNILFAKDGEVYDLDGHIAIAIGGAYSVDKYYRLSHWLKWFSDEQPDDEIKARVESKLNALDWNIDLVLSHTCPQKFVPVDAFLSCVDQSTVDRSTEEWLDTIEDRLNYQHWLCGHWHIDKAVDRFRFLMDDFITLPDISSEHNSQEDT